MATKTTGGSMYSGLLQTNQELAKAKEFEANAVSTGLEQGVKPLQGYLMGVAAEKKQRENDLKEDQRLAIDQMNMMADTSGLLGDYEPIVTGLAQTTKNALNDIAKDESLSQYEKAAKYKETVDKFNKQVSKYSSDQEIIAGVTGQYAKGAFSQAINMKGDDYIIGKALSSGNYKIQGDKYIIEGLKDSNVDTNRLKQLYLPENNAAAEKYSSQFAALGMATDDMKKVESGSRTLAMSASNTRDAAEALATMGVDSGELYLDSKENKFKTNGEFDLAKMQEEIYKRGLEKANLTFIAKTPPIIQPSSEEIMANDTYNTIQRAIKSEDFSWVASQNAKFGGEQIIGTSYDKSTGILSFSVKGPEGDAVNALETLNLNTRDGKQALGKLMLNQLKGTGKDIMKSQSIFVEIFDNLPPPPAAKPGPPPPPDVRIDNAKYPKFINDLSDQDMRKSNDGGKTFIKGNMQSPKEFRALKNKVSPSSSGYFSGPGSFPDPRVLDYIDQNFNGVISEESITKGYFDLNISDKGGKFGDNPGFRSRGNYGDDQEFTRDFNIAANKQIDLSMNTKPTIASYNQKADAFGSNGIKAAAKALEKSSTEITLEDIEIWKWLDFTGKTMSDYNDQRTVRLNEKKEDLNNKIK
jgi:hypothetical protein